MDGDEILTGEAVALEIGAASFAARAVAFIIDAVATVVLLIGLAALLFRFGWERFDGAASAALSIGLIVLVLLIIPTTVETLTRGRSLGKLALGYRIVRDDGGPVQVREAFVRSLLGIVELWITAGIPAVVCAVLNSRGKRLGDYLGGTYAVRVRGAKPAFTSIYAPPELLNWARLADVGHIPDTLALRGRIFLTRLHQLSPANRQRLAEQLAASVCAYVAPPAPPGTHPERLLAAVLSERRDREMIAHQRRSPFTEQLLAPTTNLGYGITDPAQ